MSITVLIRRGWPPHTSGFGTVNSGPMPPLDEVPQEITRIGDLASRILTARAARDEIPHPVPLAMANSSAALGSNIFGRAYPDLARKLSAEQILALREVKPWLPISPGNTQMRMRKTLRRQGIRTTDATLSLAHVVGLQGQ